MLNVVCEHLLDWQQQPHSNTRRQKCSACMHNLFTPPFYFFFRSGICLISDQKDNFQRHNIWLLVNCITMYILLFVQLHQHSFSSNIRILFKLGPEYRNLHSVILDGVNDFKQEQWFFILFIFDHLTIVSSVWAALICLDWYLQRCAESDTATLSSLWALQHGKIHTHRLLSLTSVSQAVAVINWRTRLRVSRYQGAWPLAAANLSVCQRGSGKSNTACSDRLNYTWLLPANTHAQVKSKFKLIFKNLIRTKNKCLWLIIWLSRYFNIWRDVLLKDFS